MAPLIPIAAGLGLLAFFFGTKKAKAASPGSPVHIPPPVPSGTPVVIADGPVVVPVADTPVKEDNLIASSENANVRNWQAAVLNAIASGDAAQLDRIADEMQSDGLKAQADSLREVAAEIRARALAATNATRLAADHPPVSAPELKAEEPPPVVVAPDPRIALAAKLVAYINATVKGKENKESVKAAQTALGNLTADGMYGIKTALRIAEFGVVPAVPWYLPTLNTGNAVADFDAKMIAYGNADPPRATQWFYVAERTHF